MTLLSPSSSSRRRGGRALPVATAVILALAAGIGAGWFFAGHDKTKTTAHPSASTTCSSGSGSPHTSPATSSAKPSSKKPSTKPSTKPSGAVTAYPLPQTITVNVYNATTRKGLAKATSLELTTRGFRPGSIANDPAKKIIAASAEIRYGPAGAAAARVVAAQVVGAVLVPDHRKDAKVDFVLGEGFAALAPPAVASAAISALTSPTPSGC